MTMRFDSYTGRKAERGAAGGLYAILVIFDRISLRMYIFSSFLKQRRAGESGAVLFVIILAIVLFAALGYAVSSSLRGGGKSASEESADVATASVMQTLLNTRMGLQRFLITSDYSIDQIDMFASGMTVATGDTNACTSSACNLHDPDGGNVQAPLLPNSAWIGSTPCCASYVNSSGQLKPQYIIVSIKDVGTTLPELIAYYTLVKPDVCQAVNVASGVYAEGAVNTVSFSLGALGTGYQNFTGANTSPMPVTTANQIGSTDSRLAGKTAFGLTSGGRCTLIYVLLER